MVMGAAMSHDRRVDRANAVIFADNVVISWSGWSTSPDLNGQLVTQGHGTYLGDGTNPEGLTSC
jgi:hypothetical protein